MKMFLSYIYGDSSGLITVYRLIRKLPPEDTCDIGLWFSPRMLYFDPTLFLMLRTTVVPTRNST